MNKLWFLLALTTLVFSTASRAAIFTADGIVTDTDGGMELGQFEFNVDYAGLVTIDADIIGFNSYMYLLDSNNQVVSVNNDDPRSDTNDSYIEEVLEVGIYRVTVGPNYFDLEEAIAGLRPGVPYRFFATPGSNAEFGEWSLTVTTTDVPVPGALYLFISGLVVLVSLRRPKI